MQYIRSPHPKVRCPPPAGVFVSVFLSVLAATVCMPSSESFAEGYRCIQNEDQIHVDIESLAKDEQGHCEVILWTGSDERQALWRENEPETCRVRAQNFRSLLENEEWTCDVEQPRDEGIEVTELPLLSTELGEAGKLERFEKLSGLQRQSSQFCKRDGFRRELWIEADMTQGGLPCQVRWDGDDLIEKVIWQARIQREFCSTKASATIAHWQQQGWACEVDKLPSGLIQSESSSFNPLEINWPAQPILGAKIDLPLATTDGSYGEKLSVSDLQAVGTGSVGGSDILVKLEDVAGWLRPESDDLISWRDEHNLAWLNGDDNLRLRLIDDLEQLAKSYDGDYSVRDGLFTNLYGRGRPDAVALISYRDVGDKLRFLLIVYRYEELQYRLVESAILGKDWMPEVSPPAGRTMGIRRF